MSNTHPKIADPDYPILDHLKNRWSPRAFSDKPVEEEKLVRIFEAARWAPSSYNEQPWNFIIASKQQKDTYDKIYDSLIEFNQSWSKTAPILAISVAQNDFKKNGKPNDYAQHDVGLAMGNLLAQATAEGLHLHQMAGFDKERARGHFKIPDTHTPVAAMAIGYLGEPEQLPEQMQEGEIKERSRKDLSEFIFTGNWKSPSYFLG